MGKESSSHSQAIGDLPKNIYCHYSPPLISRADRRFQGQGMPVEKRVEDGQKKEKGREKGEETIA